MDQILAEPGQVIRAGEPVGIMGEKPAPLAVASGLTSQSTPVLYIEFRKNGNPVDPSPWWAANRQEAKN
jgi:septal ring factor EnvC (AmiA/AmiB activator)